MNKIIVNGKLNSNVRARVSRRGIPYANFTLLVEPENAPSFYFRCYITGNATKSLESLSLGEEIIVEGVVESALLENGTYDKQINCSSVSKA